MLVTLILTVFVDLVTAVALGLIAAGLARAQQEARPELDSVVSVPLLEHTFFSNDVDLLETDLDEEELYRARVGLVSLRGSFSVASPTS